jgi:molybdopterin/thiamine biosynthesis adenylyltransferase
VNDSSPPTSILERPASPVDASPRYIRQELFRPIGREGQERLRQSHIALIGCGALGSAVVDLLVRAGIGKLTIVDRDYVELHNLQRQTLYTEEDVSSHTPKAEAAATRLREINSEVTIEPVITDFNSENAEEIVRDSTVLVDGTDNFETRYLLNDLSVKLGIPWVYGGVIASHGTTMTIRPGITPCLRCVFPDLPEPGSAPTCDTAGVIGPVVHAIAAIEAAEVIKLAIGDEQALNPRLLAIDLWQLTFDQVPLGSPDPDCPACGARRFEFLDRSRPAQSTVLCGHDAVQVLPKSGVKLDLTALTDRLRPLGGVRQTKFLLFFVDPTTDAQLTIFPDGRAIVKGTSDETAARSIYARYVGN